ncbi:uncharacterized protein LOC135155009 isoform X2 [Lytechinus pictus]|uniref:uncharacterized protein LOC135155009 isoform X2 n=1 Tax=Lytechinus pictus TaxID=7653 RepID=UPI0030BA14BA
MDLMRQNVILAVLTGLVLFSVLSCATSNEISSCVDSNEVECVDFDNTDNYCKVGENISARVDIRLLKEDLELILYELERVSLVSIDKTLTSGNTVKDKNFGSRFQVATNIKPAEEFGKLEIQMTLENFKRSDTTLMHVDIRLENKMISTQGKAFFPVQPEQTIPEVTTTAVTPNKKDDVHVAVFQILQDMNNTTNGLLDRMDRIEQTDSESDLHVWHLHENLTKGEQSKPEHVYGMYVYICIMTTLIVILEIMYFAWKLYERRRPRNSSHSARVSVHNLTKTNICLQVPFHVTKSGSGLPSILNSQEHKAFEQPGS